ncbi:uncharacterized protein MKZ38_005106 [Zalerion maritima]|uniref:Ubiquitin-like protease family profile domain-containing protein n=1 Tax=Zalerion maritima TaxID=339359 RepID=A0AAD5WP56_9PEZI|nr:uncharacterized protein MKZ38_005106 [Zalerion maritima]
MSPEIRRKSSVVAAPQEGLAEMIRGMGSKAQVPETPSPATTGQGVFASTSQHHIDDDITFHLSLSPTPTRPSTTPMAPEHGSSPAPHSSLSAGGAQDRFPVPSHGGVNLTYRERDMLRDPEGWLNDSIIDWCTGLLLAQYFGSKPPRTLCLSSCLHFPQVAKLPLSVAWIVHPMVASKHWTLVLVRLPQNKARDDGAVFLLNSLSTIKAPVEKAQGIMDSCGIAGQVEVVPCPQQTNGHDCGLFVLHFVDMFLRQFEDNTRSLPFLNIPMKPFLVRTQFVSQLNTTAKSHPFDSFQLTDPPPPPLDFDKLKDNLDDFFQTSTKASATCIATKAVLDAQLRRGEDGEEAANQRLQSAFSAFGRMRPIANKDESKAARARIQQYMNDQEAAATESEIARHRLGFVRRAEGITAAVLGRVEHVLAQGREAMNSVAAAGTKEMPVENSLSDSVAKENGLETLGEDGRADATLSKRVKRKPSNYS